MNSLVFRAFVGHASGGQDMPNDYLATKMAMVKMFPKLANVPMGSPLSAVAHAGGGMLGHAMEIGGLGILARPSIQRLRGKSMSHTDEAKHELLGLGTLAAPSAYHLLTRR